MDSKDNPSLNRDRKPKNMIRFILIFIFLFTLGIRLFYSFQVEGFSDDNSYFVLRQAQNIRETGAPIYHDDLSFGGRIDRFSPVYYYIISFFGFFMPIFIAGKIIPAIAASSIIFFVYLVTREITSSRQISLFIAAASSFVPVFFASTLNTASVISFILPLVFFMIFCFFRLGEKEIRKSNRAYAYVFILASAFFSLLHPYSFIFALGLIMYLVLSRLDGVRTTRGENETVFFLVILVIWAQFIIYRRALLENGLSIIWQNLPKELLVEFFSEITIGNTIYYIGIIPLFFGIYIIYRTLLKERNKKLYLLFGFVLTLAFLLVLRLIPIKVGLAFIGLLFVVLFGEFIRGFLEYIRITKFSGLKYTILGLIVTVFIVFSIVPSLSLASQAIAKSETGSDIRTFEWIRDNTDSSSLIFAPIGYGHVINFVSGRKNVADSRFFMIKDSSARYEDIKSVYSTKLETKALSVFQKYDASYVISSRKIAESFDVNNLPYLERRCFEKVYSGSIDVYSIRCSINMEDS